MMHWLPLVWLVATATATVTPVSTLEAAPSQLKQFRQHPTPPVSPNPAPALPGDMAAPVLPVPTPPAHPKELPSSGAPQKTTDPTSPEAPEEAPEHPGTTADGSTAAPGTTPGPPTTPGTSAPPCPGDGDLAEACGEPTGEQRAAVAEALVTFALRFYQRMAEAAQPDANLLFSPINVAMGLSHLLLGARGETRERLAAILAYPPELACTHGTLRQLASAPGLFSAAQIFHNPELRLRPRFLNESWHFYGARPQALSGNESLDLWHINEWVRGASRGLLPGLLTALPPQPCLLLLSAVHFQATWRTPLEAKETVLLPFLRPGHPPRMVPTMTSKKYPVASFTDPRLQVQPAPLPRPPPWPCPACASTSPWTWWPWSMTWTMGCSWTRSCAGWRRARRWRWTRHGTVRCWRWTRPAWRQRVPWPPRWPAPSCCWRPCAPSSSSSGTTTAPSPSSWAASATPSPELCPPLTPPSLPPASSSSFLPSFPPCVFPTFLPSRLPSHLPSLLLSPHPSLHPSFFSIPRPFLLPHLFHLPSLLPFLPSPSFFPVTLQHPSSSLSPPSSPPTLPPCSLILPSLLPLLPTPIPPSLSFPPSSSPSLPPSFPTPPSSPPFPPAPQGSVGPPVPQFPHQLRA